MYVEATTSGAFALFEKKNVLSCATFCTALFLNLGIHKPLISVQHCFDISKLTEGNHLFMVKWQRPVNVDFYIDIYTTGATFSLTYP